MTVRSAPVSTFVIVTATPGSTPPDVSLIVPSIDPLAAWDCAIAGAANTSASSPANNILSMFASISCALIPNPWSLIPSSMKSERFVRAIHFLEVLPHQNATGEIRAGDAVAAVTECKEVMREVAMRADVRQALGGSCVVGRPAVRGLDAGDIRIQRGHLVHQLSGLPYENFIQLTRRHRLG